MSQLEQLESAGSQLEGDSRQQEGTCDATNKSEAKPKSHAKRGKAARLAGLVKARQVYAEIRVSSPVSDGSVQPLSHSPPKLRATPPVDYSHNVRDIPFSAQLGTTTRALQTAGTKVLNFIDQIARTDARKQELMTELVTHPRFQAAIQAEGMPSRADWLIAEGVKAQLQEFQEGNLHKTVHGRVASNAVVRAAVCKMGELAQHGDKKLVQERLCYSRQGFDAVIKRMEDQTVYDLLDPGREERSDALSVDQLLLVELAWEMFTQADPVLTMNMHMPDGQCILKAVHHKKDSGDDIYDKAYKYFQSSGGMPCKRTKFKELRPAWVWEETFATCLCPYCFEMRLFQAAYVGTCRKAARPENLCTCSWCVVQKQNGVDGIPPPYHAKFVAAKRYCEKKVAPVNSGWEGVYPTYAPSCIFKDLSDKRQKFYTEKFGCTKCDNCPTFDLFPSPDQPCSFMDAENGEVRYRRYDEKPGSQYKYMEYATCTRREFALRYLDHYSIWISHRYHTEWQDAMSDTITGSHHDEERKRQLFPCKCIVADIDFAMAYSTKHGKGIKVLLVITLPIKPYP